MDDLSPRRRPEPFVVPVRIDPSGRRGPTRGQAAGPGWRQSTRGFHVPAHVDASRPEQRVAEAVPLLGVRGAVTGWGALRLLGAGFCDGLEADGRTPLPVRLTLGPGQGRRARDGVQVLQERVGPALVSGGVVVHAGHRALLDEMRVAADLREAVVVADMTLAAGVVRLDELVATAAAHPRWRGIEQARRALRLVDAASDSPPESRLRLHWVLDARLPPPLVNRPVFCSRTARLLGYPDLLEVEAGLALEYDGADHRRVGRQTGDNHRDDAFRACGLEVLRVTGLDLLGTAALVARLVAARQRAARRTDRGCWTLVPPPGWRDRRRR